MALELISGLLASSRLEAETSFIVIALCGPLILASLPKRNFKSLGRERTLSALFCSNRIAILIFRPVGQ